MNFPPHWQSIRASAEQGQAQTLLAELASNLVELLALAEPPAASEPYGRRQIFHDQAGEILLMKWRENSYCAPHDHGDAHGFIFLLQGTFIERHYQLTTQGLKQKSERRFVSPTVLPVGAGAIHDMTASGDGFGLHIYLPPIRNMRVFNVQNRQTLVVSDQCGAWIPSDSSLIVECRDWAP